MVYGTARHDTAWNGIAGPSFRFKRPNNISPCEQGKVTSLSPLFTWHEAVGGLQLIMPLSFEC